MCCTVRILRRCLVLLLRRLVLAVIFLASFQASATPRTVQRDTPRRFFVRLQFLSGLAPSLVSDGNGQSRLTAFVPLDVELATRLDGVLSLAAAVQTELAPFSLPNCVDGPPLRPHAASSLVGARIDLNNNRDGSWWSPWVALRMGIGGQIVSDGSCASSVRLFPAFSPRLGADLWMGKSAASFSVGYDYLPTGSLVTLQIGLSLRVD